MEIARLPSGRFAPNAKPGSLIAGTSRDKSGMAVTAGFIQGGSALSPVLLAMTGQHNAYSAEPSLRV